MKEKKGISQMAQRIREWWNKPETNREFIKGTAAGIVITSACSALMMKHIQERNDFLNDQFTEEQCNAAYHKGLRTGEMRGYYNLLMNSEDAFKRMGIKDIKHF